MHSGMFTLRGHGMQYPHDVQFIFKRSCITSFTLSKVSISPEVSELLSTFDAIAIFSSICDISFIPDSTQLTSG